MLKLEVIHYKGAVPSRPISAQFESQGGTIGRGDTNTLVLPDAERFISRTHAKIKFQADRYLIEDHGSSTPVMVNGRPLGKGSEAALAHGDELTIGEYHLRAIVQLVVAGAAPFEGTRFGVTKADDPMAMFGPAGTSDPFADLIPKPAANEKLSGASAAPLGMDPFGMPQRSAQGAIPADFDPFANLGQPSVPPPVQAPLAGGAGGAFGAPAPSPSLDALFGLGPSTSSDPLAGNGPLAAPAAASPFKNAPSLDPMAAFQDKPAPSAAPAQRNNVPELQGSFLPPKAIPATEIIAPARREPPAVEPVPVQRDLAPIPIPIPAPAPAPIAAEAKVVAAAPAAAIKSAPVPTPDVPPESQPDAGEDADALAATLRLAVVRPGADELVSAFLRGAGIENLNLPSGLTPQTMHLMGQVMRENVQAILDLLLARAMLKRELRAEVTMIVAQENNPLKFSPNVETALGHLLAPQRGYMEPLEAIKDACNDLRSNQFAFMAGMRAALAGILQRFNPEQLEKRLKQKSMLDSLLPGSRKAKMWDLFSDLYEDVSKEAEDDFHQLFGREFLRAYEAQVAKLSRQDRNAERPKNG